MGWRVNSTPLCRVFFLCHVTLFKLSCAIQCHLRFNFGRAGKDEVGWLSSSDLCCHGNINKHMLWDSHGLVRFRKISCLHLLLVSHRKRTLSSCVKVLCLFDPSTTSASSIGGLSRSLYYIIWQFYVLWLKLHAESLKWMLLNDTKSKKKDMLW